MSLPDWPWISSYNDLRRACSRAPKLTPEWRALICAPAPIELPSSIKREDLDLDVLRTLPEFSHWNTIGQIAILRDLELLDRNRMTLLELFRRGPVKESWYYRLDRYLEDRDREGVEESVNKKIQYLQAMLRRRMPADKVRTTYEELCEAEGFATAIRADHRPTRPAGPAQVAPSSRLYEPAHSVSLTTSATSDTDSYRPTQAHERKEPTFGFALSHSPSWIAACPSAGEFGAKAHTKTLFLWEFLELLWKDVKGLEDTAAQYRKCYNNIWRQIREKDSYRLDSDDRNIYHELRYDLEGEGQLESELIRSRLRGSDGVYLTGFEHGLFRSRDAKERNL